MANLVISAICNQNCAYCFTTDHRQPGHDFLPLGAFGERLDFLFRSGIQEARLLGGEPTLHPQFPELVSRRPAIEQTAVRVGRVTVGRGLPPVLIAGPCAVESEEQLAATAQRVRQAGPNVILRGGAFKPRTSPYSFQGLGQAGLCILRRVADAFDLPAVSEVLAPGDVELVAQYADMLQVGARAMHNTPLLAAVGRCSRPVLLKRGYMATVEEFLLAAEYILSQGNGQVVLCERGIRTFEPYTRNTLDVGAIALLNGLTHLPVIADPSHAAGRRDLVLPLARAALAAGAAGIMVEVHPNPTVALSDGAQSLTFDQFEELCVLLHFRDS